MHRLKLVALLALVALASVACGDGDTTAEATFGATGAITPTTGDTTTAGTTVEVADNVFRPEHITVTTGTTVVWKWVGSAPHTVTATSGPEMFDSKDMAQTSGEFQYTFDTAGKYEYYCKVHGQSMSGTVTVS